MALKFGTSGLRGLVAELTAEAVRAHVRAFLSCCAGGARLTVGHDLRPSSPDIARLVAGTAAEAGIDVLLAGPVPTPALVAGAAGAAAIMVTGSHIPADRNGLKFFAARGEITKADEAAIVAALGRPFPAAARRGTVGAAADPGEAFVRRYLAAFPPAGLEGRRIGLFSHSTVARDLLGGLLARLGAEVVELGRSDSFIALDTEAVDDPTRARLRDWADALRLDAIASADGDGDRPLLTDERGVVIPGDILGQITASLIGARTVVTPVSSNSGVSHRGFERVIRTMIGSPFVIAGMERAGGRVAGYEANGGFLLGFEARLPGGAATLAPLVTRDSFLPILAVLLAAGKGPISARVAEEPPFFTAADRLPELSTTAMGKLMERLAGDAQARQVLLLDPLGLRETGTDRTDGLRILCEGGRVLHLRPSGNAPEMRLYVETGQAQASADLLARGLAILRQLL